MQRYQLDDLRWFQFETLIQTLLKAAIGVGIESWRGVVCSSIDSRFRLNCRATLYRLRPSHE